MGAEQCFLFSHVENDTETGGPWTLIRMDDGQLYCAELTGQGGGGCQVHGDTQVIHPRVLTMQCAVSPATQGSSRSPIT